MPTPPKDLRQFDSLVEIVEILLSPEGCPWDRKQTPQTLAPFAVEEAYELAEALEKKSVPDIKEELGDFLLQVVLHAAIARRDGDFALPDVIEGISDKIVRRHPHVFGETKVKDADEVLKNWDQIKTAEKKAKGADASNTGGLFSIPVALPALQRAQKIGDKSKNYGFDWTQATDVFEKVKEEVKELEAEFTGLNLSNTPRSSDELTAAEKIRLTAEMGDVFFSLAQLARHLGLEAESIARAGNRKFEERFAETLRLSGLDKEGFKKLSSEKKEAYWLKAKLTSAE